MAGTANGILVTPSVQFTVTDDDDMNLTTAELTTTEFELSTDDGNEYDDLGFVFDDYTQRCIVGVIFVIVSITGTFGNSLVILAVILSRKLRTVTNVFVVNLAVADLLVCLILPWNAVGLFTKPEYDWPLPKQLCVAIALIGYTCGGCSIFTLATIAINRWMIITQPPRTYRTCYRPAFLTFMLVIVWLIPFLATCLPPIFGLGQLGYTPKYSTCTHNTDHPLAMYYSLLQSVVLFPVPYIIIIVCYVKIFKHVREHTKVLMSNQDQSMELSDASSPRHGERTSGHKPDLTPQRSNNLSVSKKRLSRRQVEITKNLFYVVCAFTICIVPYGVALVIPPSDPIIPWTGALLLVNSCINPAIYATKHPYFKLVFRLMLKCQCARIPEQSEFLRSLRSTIRRGQNTS